MSAISPEEMARAEQALEKVRDTWLAREGVTAIDLGFKWSSGEMTAQLSIRVHVARKKHKTELSPAEFFPEEVDGVPVTRLGNTFEDATSFERLYDNPVLTEAFAAELDRIDPDRPGQFVGVRFERPTGLRCGRRTDRTGRLMIRVHRRRLDVNVVDLVRAERVHGRHVREERRVGAVRPVVEQYARPSCDQPSFARGTRGDLDHHALATPIRGEKFFLATEYESHGSPRGPRERGDVGLVVEAALAAEPPAYFGSDELQAILGDERQKIPGMLCILISFIYYYQGNIVYQLLSG